jgi:hypothetical protein
MLFIFYERAFIKCVENSGRPWSLILKIRYKFEKIILRRYSVRARENVENQSIIYWRGTHINKQNLPV